MRTIEELLYNFILEFQREGIDVPTEIILPETTYARMEAEVINHGRRVGIEIPKTNCIIFYHSSGRIKISKEEKMEKGEGGMGR